MTGFIRVVEANEGAKHILMDGKIIYPKRINDGNNTVFFGDIFGLANSDGSPSAFAKRIAGCRPDIIYTGAFRGCGYGSFKGEKNLTPQVVDYFHSKGILVFAHICGTDDSKLCPERWWRHDFEDPTCPPNDCKTLIDEILKMSPNVDGISDGEVTCMHRDDPRFWKALDFFTDYSEYVRSKGKLVMFNTGTALGVSEEIMELCDILCVEKQGVTLRTDPRCTWTYKYKPERFQSHPTGYGWRCSSGQCQGGYCPNEVINIMNYHFNELKIGNVAIVYNPNWGGHAFPNCYDWWDEVFQHFLET